MIKINEVHESAVEEKIANLILKHKEGFTIEDAEKLAKWAKNNPLKVIFGSKEDIISDYQRDQKVVMN